MYSKKFFRSIAYFQLFQKYIILYIISLNLTTDIFFQYTSLILTYQRSKGTFDCWYIVLLWL